ncbi:hypothetical protein [Campylobacter rectus]|uniref:hypothetical protein n=1 Tax=Campylobacter rectus TaxID=203 RepID=UPI0028DC21CB|nr:hypothetical protein [Campylobacter rectus]
MTSNLASLAYDLRFVSLGKFKSLRSNFTLNLSLLALKTNLSWADETATNLAQNLGQFLKQHIFRIDIFGVLKTADQKPKQ